MLYHHSAGSSLHKKLTLDALGILLMVTTAYAVQIHNPAILFVGDRGTKKSLTTNMIIHKFRTDQKALISPATVCSNAIDCTEDVSVYYAPENKLFIVDSPGIGGKFSWAQIQTSLNEVMEYAPIEIRAVYFFLSAPENGRYNWDHFEEFAKTIPKFEEKRLVVMNYHIDSHDVADFKKQIPYSVLSLHPNLSIIASKVSPIEDEVPIDMKTVAVQMMPDILKNMPQVPITQLPAPADIVTSGTFTNFILTLDRIEQELMPPKFRILDEAEFPAHSQNFLKEILVECQSSQTDGNCLQDLLQEFAQKLHQQLKLPQEKFDTYFPPQKCGDARECGLQLAQVIFSYSGNPYLAAAFKELQKETYSNQSLDMVYIIEKIRVLFVLFVEGAGYFAKYRGLEAFALFLITACGTMTLCLRRLLA